MTINKNTDLEFSLQKGTEKGGVYTNFYTEDKGSASIRIRLSSNEYYLNLTKTDLKPVLFLFHEDGSIFEIREFINVMPDKGLIQYNLSDNVIRHAGKVKAKLFLKNTEQSVHVANFTFDIKDSGVEGVVAKEIKVNVVDDAVRRIIKENAIELLGKGFEERLNQDVFNHIENNPELFKGDKGDTGLQGPKGDKGDTGNKGLSAYEIAVNHGYLGTEEEWVSQLNNNSLYLNHFNPDKKGIEPSGDKIQKTLDLMKKFNINNLYIDNGTYLIDRRMYIYSDSNIIMSKNTKLLRGHNGGFFDNGNPSANVGEYNGEGNITITGGTLDNNYENINKYPTNQINMIALRHGDNIKIENVKFRNSITVHCLDVNGTQNLQVKNCTFEGYINLTNADMKEAIQLSEYVTGGIEGGIFDGIPTQNVTIENCTFKESDILGGFNVGIGNHLAINNIFTNNINIKNNKFSKCNIGVRVWKWKDVTVTNNSFNNVAEAMRVSSIDASYQSANNVDGTPSNNSQAGNNIVFSNNKINNFTSVAIGIYGVQSSNTAVYENICIKDNIINNSTKQGQCIILELCENVEIDNNFIKNCYRGLSYKSCNFINITSNVIYNATTEGIYNDIQTFTGLYRISKYIVIENNVINTIGKNGIYLNSSHTFRVVGNMINDTNNDNLGGSLRGAIYAFTSDYGRIENNMCYGALQNFVVRVQTVSNSNIHNNSGNGVIRFDGTNTNTKKGYYDVDGTGNII